MPKVKLGAGVEVDILSASELHDELEGLKEHLRRTNMRRIPTPRTVSNAVVLSAAGAGTIILGAPGMGDAWDVRAVAVTPADPTIAAMTAVAVIWAREAGNPFNFRDRNGSGVIPAVSPWSSRQFTLRQNENLVVTITGGTALAPVIASAQVLEADFADIYGRELS